MTKIFHNFTVPVIILGWHKMSVVSKKMQDRTYKGRLIRLIPKNKSSIIGTNSFGYKKYKIP